MDNHLRLKRHETFSIREGWIEKVLNTIKENPNLFKKEDGTRILGMGSNMVKSLRYWMEATSLAVFNNKGAFLTEIGEKLYENDRYLENDFSWWIIHLYLSTNQKDAPVINEFFNVKCHKFDKESITKIIGNRFESIYGEYTEASLESDISILLKSYYSADYSNPEINFNCPLSKLGLLKMSDKNTYVRTSSTARKLNYRIVYLALINCFNDGNNSLSFNVEDLYDRRNNPLSILNLSKTSFFMYLDEMKKRNLLKFQKTAGLNTVYIDEIKSIDWIIDDYFKEVQNELRKNS